MAGPLLAVAIFAIALCSWVLRVSRAADTRRAPIIPRRTSARAPTANTSARSRAVVQIPATGRGYFQEVRGESHHQDVLRALLRGASSRECFLRLTAEPENAYDTNAVAVQTLAGETVGHLPRDVAAQYQQTLIRLANANRVGVASARLVGGTASKPSIGVYLDVEPPTIVAKRLGLPYTPVRRYAGPVA